MYLFLCVCVSQVALTLESGKLALRYMMLSVVGIAFVLYICMYIEYLLNLTVVVGGL